MIYLELLKRFWWAVPLVLLLLAIGVQTHRLNTAQADLASLQTEYDTFKGGVEALGNAQIAKNKEIVANQERVSRETSTSYQHRLDLINAEYKRLRDSKGNPSSSPAAPVSTAPAPVDDTARNDELLRLLRQAQIQTSTLIELQNWLKGVK